jgi:hypothetical protein
MLANETFYAFTFAFDTSDSTAVIFPLSVLIEASADCLFVVTVVVSVLTLAAASALILSRDALSVGCPWRAAATSLVTVPSPV